MANLCKRTGKKRYQTWDDAHASLTGIRRVPGDNKKPARVYPCPFCSGFHLTSKAGTEAVGKPAGLKHSEAFKKFMSNE